MGSARGPGLIRPMLAVAGELPTGSEWAYEFKWDGVRAVAYLGGGKVKLMTRNDRDVTATYPDVALASDQSLVLDGELVTLDERGAPSFSALQRRMHVVKPSAALIASTPVQYIAFDLLYQGTSLIKHPWHERRALLEELPFQISPSFPGDPLSVMAAAKEQGLEGVVSKRVDSAYYPGQRSPFWRKTALIQTTEVIIGGYKIGQGRREGTVGSLLLGAYDPQGRLAYLGGVGTGFTGAMLDDLSRRLRPLERATSPFAEPLPTMDARDAHWVKPVLVGEVVYRTLTPDGRLRHSSWRGLRPDREPAEVKRDSSH